jgi:hypothetical protein
MGECETYLAASPDTPYAMQDLHALSHWASEKERAVPELVQLWCHLTDLQLLAYQGFVPSVIIIIEHLDPGSENEYQRPGQGPTCTFLAIDLNPHCPLPCFLN